MDFIKNYLNKISDCSVSFTSALTDESLDEMIYKYEDPLKAELLPIVIYASANDSYPKDLKYCLGNMDCYVFIYVISGKLSLKVDDKDFLVSENGFVFLNCNNAFSLISLAESKIYTIYFGGVSVNPYYDAFSTYSSLPICYPDSSSCMLKELLNIRFLPKKLTLSLSFLPAKYIIDILTDLSVKAMVKNRTAEKIPEYLLKIKRSFDYSFEESYSLDDFESEFGIDKYRICREFKASFGSSPIKYLNENRIKKAMQLLTETNLTVHEIGSKIGIDNTNHFINLFKKEAQKTPLSYRQAMLSDIN